MVADEHFPWEHPLEFISYRLGDFNPSISEFIPLHEPVSFGGG